MEDKENMLDINNTAREILDLDIGCMIQQKREELLLPLVLIFHLMIELAIFVAVQRTIS